MILKDYAVNIPFDLGGIVVKREKWVEMETERTYPEGKKGSRVKRVTIGQVVPLFPGKMYPNENYFSLVVPNSVPEKVRDDFLRRCERKRELAELKKDPERMMRQVENGIRFLKEEGRKIKMEQGKAFYASRNPKDTLDGYKAAMFNRILEELKLTMPEHRILQGLETIAAPGEDGKGMTYSDALMLLTWYKNCLRG